MVDYGTFFVDGKSASKFGVLLQKPPVISEPKPIVISEQVYGRNGSMLYDTGGYSNRTIRVSCFVLKPKAGNYISAINAWLTENVGYRKLEFSNIPDKFFLGRIVGGAKFDIRANVLAPFQINFDCKPQAFLKSGDKFLTVNNGDNIYNPAANHAKPLIHLKGSGDISLTIGDRTVDIFGLDGDIMLDSEQQSASYGSTNLNSLISCNEFPELQAGGNWISWSGDVDLVELKPRWFDL